MPLAKAFLARPIAHRALHDRGARRPENSRAAVRAAVAGGWGIELDLQLSRDGVAMVFHDHDLKRLTGAEGMLSDRTAAELGQIALTDADDGIPTFAEILELVAGRVPLLVEIKDRDGALGTEIGSLEQAAATALAGYAGPVALMSFNPHSVAEMARLLPEVPRGLTSCGFPAEDWPMLTEARRAELALIPDAARTGASFISHQHSDLENPRVAELKAAGLSILCWTIRSPEAEARARLVADNITFEGYLPE